MQRLKVVKILAALSILNSSGDSPGATEKVVALVACSTCSGAGHSSVRNEGLGINEKNIYEGVIVPTLSNGAETWGMKSIERRIMNVLEMKCLTVWY